MGLRESKLCFLPYEEAVKRVTDEEMQRLRLAFKRASGVSGLMVETLFAREVLGDCVPVRVAEQIYTAFGGTTKGINFGNLLCGLVLLTRGTREEKIKFLFNVYTSDGVHVTKESLENAIIASDGGIVSAQVNECFSVIDKLSFDEFAKWLSRNPDVTSLSRWLLIIGNGCSVQLTDSSETPTFYQTLATVTHLHEADIIELEKKYWYLKSTSKTGKFDLEAFTRLVSPPIPSIICPGLFKAFDENCDNHIDFREMACGISACCRGTSLERHQFCFKVFDTDGDGLLSKDEITVMCQTLLEIRRDNNPEKDTNNQFSESDAFLMTEEILANCGKEKDGKISLNEYQQWADDHRFSLFFPKLLVQVCHIVLGLKPASREIELQVAKGWIERENQQGLKPGSVWYLVSMSWWRTWKEHVNYQTMRRSSTGSMKRNGAPPTKTTQVPPTPKTSVNSTWSYDSLKAKTIGRRESHPVFSNKGMSPANGSINGHCIPGNDAVMVGPGQIDNTSLIETENRKIPILTGEGGKLKRTVPLSRGRDFEIIPDPVWKALLLWYGGGPALPRTVIVPKHGDSTPELELFPINLKIFRHAPPPTRGGITTWTGVGFGLSSFGFGNNSMTATHAPPKKYLAFLAAFSRINTLQQVLEYTSGRLRIRVEDLRLWIMEDDNTLTLLEEDAKSLEDLNINDNMTLLLEVRNRDMSWPEEMSSLASNKSLKEKLNNEPTEKGATGLSNLGNTCFMNSALQCLSNTQPLTQYFTNRCHYYELNRTNPLGMKGHIARRYGDLVEDLWSGSSRSLAPLKLRWTIGRYAPRFNGFQQHDSQEFLSFLLDGLHEDLNRVHNKPYVELKDSDGRPDEIVSQEAWDNHFKRNQSVVVDLFQGQLKSQVRCLQCGYVSARFDPFTFLSLPLPMDNSIYVEIVVVPLSGAVPTKYALLLDNDDKYKAIKKGLSKLCDIKAENLLLVEVYGATVKNIPSDTIKIRSTIAGFLYAYEIPPEQPPTVHKTESQTTSKERTQDVEPAVVQQSSPYICPMNECNELENKNCSQNSSNNSLKVDENWFNDDNKRKKNSGLLKKFSPKIRKKISPKLNGSYSPGRKSSESSESSQSSVSNADSGIALMNGQPTNTVPSVSVTETNPVLPSNTQDCNLNTGGSNAQNCVTNTSFSTNRQNSVTNSGLPSNMSGSLTPTNSSAPCGFTFNGFAVAIHRKMMRQDAYFMSHQKNSPSLFGIPVIVPCTTQTKQSDLYQAVWTQVSRLLSAPPPGDKNAKNGETGEYPFELRAVQKDGLTCSWCPWYRFCRGCPIQCSDQEYGNRSSFLAIEWDPTTLHLRYQSSLEKTFTEHDSVEKSRKLQTEPIDLHECLTAFTKEEELGEDELWYCNKCKKQRLAVKKLEIWSLPPILVIHLKRFQYVNGHWVKSNKIVNYPMAGFDPSAFLVKRSATSPHNSVTTVNVKSNESDERDKCEAAAGSDVKEQSQHDSSDIESITRTPSIRSSSQVDVANRSRHSSTSSINSAKALTDVETHEQRSPVATSGDCCVDQPVGSLRPLHEQSHGCKEVDEIRNRASSMAFNTPTYKLYAMSCHSGVLGGGHYISYSHNPNGRWYCYNDSSCKECDESKMHKDSPYMLFYEQENLQTGKFLPKFKDQTPDTNSDDEEYENDVKRMCTIQ